MPSWQQIQELCDSCTWQYTKLNDVKGMLVTGPNGNTMFLPSASYRDDSPDGYVSLGGFYWSRTLVPYDSNSPVGLGIYLRAESIGRQVDVWGITYNYRYVGFTVRAVLDSQNWHPWPRTGKTYIYDTQAKQLSKKRRQSPSSFSYLT